MTVQPKRYPCIYCGSMKTTEGTDEEYRCEEHGLVWMWMPEGDEYV